MPNTIVGLDFGHGVIRAAEVSADGKHQPVLHRYHEVQVPVDAIKEGVVTDVDAVVSALTWLWKVAAFSSKKVVTGIGSQQVLIRELILPRMPLAHIRETLPFRVQELLPLPAEQAVLDFYGVEEVEHEGEAHIRGLLVAATRESVLANTRAIEAAGLKVVDVDLIPFAVVRAHVEHERSGVKIYLHVGAVSTSVIVAEQGVPQFIRMLPSGGNDLTAALAEKLGLFHDRADEMKRRFGLIADEADLDSRGVATVSVEAAKDLVQAVRSTVAFWQNNHPESQVDGVVLSGGGAMLRGLPEALQSATGLAVTISRPAGRFTVGDRVDEASFLAAGAAPAVALGLTIRSAA
ncbi:type IV pilus assembly protein PilM [Amnibacterium kyonggiense]|uniref:Type IV pilus assembly protein PilM n=1 Tax=Amnibacterium kyonggiense TaxID=595671 RepID=A0A4R7FR49_9MICO|nr:type IV pilus assembly protein PilM [Amnibacterium kyonggiense]TDS80109.1 type IV pilus assembly protein PilM [Amnibacterium kyonggiense]